MALKEKRWKKVHMTTEDKMERIANVRTQKHIRTHVTVESIFLRTYLKIIL